MQRRYLVDIFMGGNILFFIFFYGKILKLRCNENNNICRSIFHYGHLKHDVQMFDLVEKFKVPRLKRGNNQLKLQTFMSICLL